MMGREAVPLVIVQEIEFQLFLQMFSTLLQEYYKETH